MSGLLILSSNRLAYENVMSQACGGPQIVEDLGETLRVNFCNAGMQLWVQAGYWYSY